MEEKPNNLKHLKVEGFKSIAKLDLPMGDINILIGANGSGKSNLISLFTFLSQLSQGKLKHYVAIEGGAERFFHFGTKKTKQIVLDVEVGINGYHVEFASNLDDDSLVFSKELCTIEGSNKIWEVEARKGESGLTRANIQKRNLVGKYTRDYLDECRVYHFHDTSSQAPFKKTQKLGDYHYLEKNAANIAPFLYHLMASSEEGFQQSYQQIVAAVRSVAPFFHAFYLDPTGEDGDESIRLRWMHMNGAAPFSANVLSDGTARFICLATLFLQPKKLRPATIILDEPELGLHPAALEVLADIIRVTSKQTQVICATQSVALANLFAPEDFIIVDANKGASEFRRLEREPLKDWLEDYGMGDIWAKNLIGGRPAW